jgi:phage terminase large subunit
MAKPGRKPKRKDTPKEVTKVVAQWNPVFLDAHKTRCRYVVMKGSAGSGKSVDTAQLYIRRLMMEPGRNLLVCRKVDESNRDSTFAELRAAIQRLGVGAWWDERLSTLGLNCKLNGNQVLFRGMYDDRQREKTKSITVEKGHITDIWLEEATEFTEDDLNILDDRLRGDLPPPLFYQIRMTFNPVSALHWIKRNFFDIQDPNVFTHHSTYLDNRFCDEAYHQRMERRKKMDPEGYRVYGLGEWGETEGLILTNFKIHDFSDKDRAWDGESIGQDFGFNHATAILLIGWKDGEVYVRKEIYVTEQASSRVIERATAEKWPKDLIMYCDAAEPDRITEWRRAGYRAISAKKEQGSVKAQIDWLKGRTIHIHPSCVNTIREANAWRWQKDRATGLYIDKPVEVEDDAMAALRYGVEQWRSPSGGKFIKARIW